MFRTALLLSDGHHQLANANISSFVIIVLYLAITASCGVSSAHNSSTVAKGPEPSLSITTQTLSSATVGSPYSASLSATGGVPPYSWGVSSGILPDGFQLNRNTGTLSGTTSQTGVFPFQANVTDSQGIGAYASLSILAQATILQVVDDIAVDVVQAPNLGGLVNNNILVIDTMIANAGMFRLTDAATQTGANRNFAYGVPCGGSADNNIASLLDDFVEISDTGGNYFLRFVNFAGHNSLPLYPNLDVSKGNLIVSCGEFSYTNDLLFYAYGGNGTITQYNLTGYNTPSISSPSALPTQTAVANFANVLGGTATWTTAGGIDRNDSVNSLSFHIVQGYSTTGPQNSGCISAEAVTNAVNPVLNDVIYYVYNTCTGMVTEYTWSGSAWAPATIGTVAMDDRFCIHNLKYHGGAYATVTANRGGSCDSVVTGNRASYYFWQLGTATVIPCIACTGHETEYLTSFIGADNADNDGNNFQQIAYSTAGAGVVNISGTTMTFVGSGIGPNSSMTGLIAINNVAYPISSCNSSTCTLVTSAGTQTGVRYNWPVTGPQGGGSYGAPELIDFPTLWKLPPCDAGSFPYSNQPCLKTPLDSHMNSNANPGNDTGMVFYSTTTYGAGGFPRALGIVSVSSGTVTLTYGDSFASSWEGHNIVINGQNCIASYVSSSQITVSGCSLGTLTGANYLFTLYPGGGYDEVDGVVGGGAIPAPGYNYRFSYEYNSTLSPYFATQNGLTSCTPDGQYCFISTDWQCQFGTTTGAALSYCPPDWPTNQTVASGALLLPRTHNSGGYVYSTTSSCTTGSTEPGPWIQRSGGTQSDGGCIWTNIGAPRGDIVVLQVPTAPPA